MNMLTQSLDRKSFIIWSALYFLTVAGIVFATVSDFIPIGEGTGTAGELAAYLLFGAFAIIGFIIFIRRIENTALPIWLSLLYVLPLIGIAVWFLLFFVPPKKPAQ
jgi:uncharacterized membrane protein YhaH (DUF805 family)